MHNGCMSYTELLTTTDRRGNARFSYFNTRAMRTFPVKKADAIAAILQGARVYEGNYDALLKSTGRYLTSDEAQGLALRIS